MEEAGAVEGADVRDVGSRASRLASAGFALGGGAILLRLASDWIFPQGGPLPYQLVQAALLAAGLAMLWPERERIFVSGGDLRGSLRRGLWAVPAGLAAGLGLAWMRFGGPQWPAMGQLPSPIANNVFFCLVEELEFRGFLLGWLLARRVRPSRAILGVALVHLLAHAHRFWNGDATGVLATFLVTLWLTWLVARTRSLWGAYVGHLAWNLLVFLPALGSGTNLR